MRVGIFFAYILISFSPLMILAGEERITLSQFLEKVRAQNVDLKVEEAKSKALEAKAGGTLVPPPMVGFSKMSEDIGYSATGIEINQTIPFPTKIIGDKQARQNAAKSQNEARLGRNQEILAQAKLLYTMLWIAQERVDLLSQKKAAIEEHLKLTRSRVRSDSFSKVHLLKTESDLDLLDSEIITFQQKLKEAQNEVAVFINMQPGTISIVVQEPPLPTAPTVTETSHQIKSKQLALKSAKSREFEAKSAWLPDINLRYKESGGTSMPSRYREVMVGVTLPFVFFWEPNSMAGQAIQERAQAEYELVKEQRSIESEKSNLLNKAGALTKQIALFKERLIPRAQQRVKLVHNIAARDLETLQDHRETMESLPDLKLKLLTLREEYQDTISKLEKYTLKEGSTYE